MNKQGEVNKTVARFLATLNREQRKLFTETMNHVCILSSDTNATAWFLANLLRNAKATKEAK